MNTIHQPSPLTLGAFRGGFFPKLTALFTTAVFSFVFYLSPAGAEVANSRNKPQTLAEQRLAQAPNAVRLSHHLARLQTLVTKDIPNAQAKRKAEAGFIARLLGSDDVPVNSDEQSELASLSEAISGEYAHALSKLDERSQGLEQKVREAKLPAVALTRHQAMRDKLAARFEQMNRDLAILTQSDDEQRQSDALTSLDQQLKGQRFSKSYAPFNPEQLPFRTPSAKVREPAANATELLGYLNINPYANYLQLATTAHDPQILAEAYQRANGPSPEDLAPTVEAPLSEAITTLAAELNHNPVDIYTWVHNNIRFIPSYGSIQGAEMTLQTKRGNAVDTASLLIALLRASGIPARYAYGVINVPIDKLTNWVGGVDNEDAAANLLGQGGIPNVVVNINGVSSHFKLEHAWVEAYVDFEPSRGIKNKHGDHWIVMDASLKQYAFSGGCELESQVLSHRPN